MSHSTLMSAIQFSSKTQRITVEFVAQTESHVVRFEISLYLAD